MSRTLQLYLILVLCALAQLSPDPVVQLVGIFLFMPAFVGVWIRTRV